MTDEYVIEARQLSKCYAIYSRPEDRLKQMLLGKISRRKYYREFWALRNVDLDVKKGETLGIVGRNGSGKSTLLQLIAGTLHPTHGSVQVRGRVAALLELGAGFNPEFTGRENVYINAAILGLTRDDIDSRFDLIAGFADIGQFLDQPVKTYSSGMFARLAFSVAIHVDPEILIVDEILAVGDAAFQRRCMNRFYKIRDSGCTILFVAHDAYQIRSLCQRAIYLSQGETVACGAASDVMDRYTFDIEESVAKSQMAAAPGNSEALIAVAEPDQLFSITHVGVENSNGDTIEEIQSGQDIQVRMRYRALTSNFPRKVSFVVNFYRHDDLYVCGTTTLMEGLPPFDAHASGEVVVHFPEFRMLAGKYKWRVAINDDVGHVIHTEAKNICPIRVVDTFKAVGLVDLPRRWEVREISQAGKAA